MGFMDKVVFDEAPSGKFSNNIQFDTITSTVLNPSGGLTVPQGFVDGAATNQNLHKPTPPQGTLGKALTWLKDAAVDMSEYALTAPATAAAGVNRGLGSLQTAFSYAPQSDETVLQYDENLGFYEENPLGLATLRQHDEAGVQAGLKRMADSDLVMKQVESEKPMDTLPGRVMRKGLFQVSNMAPTLAMAAVPVVGPDAALMAMSMSSGADPVQKARELKLDDVETADYINKTVAPEWAGEKVALGSLLSALGGRVPFVKSAIKLAATEFGGELVTSHFQFAADKAYEKPGLTRDQRDKIYNDIVSGRSLADDKGLKSEWLDVMKDTAEGVAGMVGITSGGGKLYRKTADRLQDIPAPTREQVDAAEQQQKQAGIQNDYNRYFEQQGYGPASGLQQQAAVGTGQTAAPGGEQGGGQSGAAAPAAAEQAPVSQADYELQAAAEVAAQQEMQGQGSGGMGQENQAPGAEDDIQDFTLPATLPQQAAAVAPAVQPSAEPAGTLTRAAQTITGLVASRRDMRNGLTMPAAQGINPVVPEYGPATMPPAPSEVDLALQWGQQQLSDPANSKFDLQNMQMMMKSADPAKSELVRYWRAFTGQKKQPVAKGLTGAIEPIVARDAAGASPAVPAATAVSVTAGQQNPEPAAVAPTSSTVAGKEKALPKEATTPSIDDEEGAVEHLARVEEFMQEKAQHAELIPAVRTEKGVDAKASIAQYEQSLQAAGWQKQGADWVKGDRSLFLRSQGDLAPPIVQWSPVKKPGPVSESTPAPTLATATKTAGKERRKGEVGMELEADERVLTSSGRLTTEFPKINLATKKTAANTMKRVDQWLMDNAIEEARSRGDKFNQRQFAANREKPSQADKDSAEQYLFGEKQPDVVPGILKPLVQKTEQAQQQQDSPQFKGAAEYPRHPAALVIDEEYRVNEKQLQKIADYYGDGTIHRLTDRDRFETGLDHGNPEYGHKFSYQKEPVRGITSFAINADDDIISVKDEAAAGSGIIYSVRPEDVGGLFVVVRKSDNSLFVYAANKVDTGKATVLKHGQALKSLAEEIAKERQGIIHDVKDEFTDDSAAQLLADLGVEEVLPISSGTVPGAVQGQGDFSQVIPPTLSRSSKGNLDLKFAERPADETIQRLTETGFKFNQKQKVWYASATPEAAKLAEELSGSKLPAVTSKKKTGLRNFLTEIKEAGGIKPQSLVDALDKNEVNGGRWIRIKNKSGFGVDQMAIRMQTAGWPVPVDVDGNPDTDAFAQLLKDAVNGNPPVHSDNADKAVAVQLAAELDQISQLTDEDYELQSLLNQEETGEYIDQPIENLLVDLFDILDESDYSEIKPVVLDAIKERDQILQEIEYGAVTGKTAEGGSGNTEDVQQAGPAATREEEGGTAVDRDQATEDEGSPGAKDDYSEIKRNAYKVASGIFGNNIYSKTIQNDWQKLLDAVDSQSEQSLVKLMSEYGRDEMLDGMGSGTSGAGPGKVRQARRGAAQLSRFAHAAHSWLRGQALSRMLAPIADPRTSLPSLDDFNKLFDEMAEQKTVKGRDLFTVEQLKEFDRLGIDVSGVTSNYKTEALQQLEYQKEQQAKLSGNDYDDKVQAEYDRIAREQAKVFESGNGAIRKLGKNFEVELRDGRTKNFKSLDDAKRGLMLGWEAEVKPRSEVVSKSGEQQVKLFATPPTFGKKPQNKGKAVDTGTLLDNFTDESTVQPDMFSTPARPSAEDSKAAIRAILAAKNNTDGPLVVKQSGDDLYRVANDPRDDETYLQLRPHILNLWQGAQNGDGLAEAVPRFIASLLKDFGADIKPYAETFYKEILNGDILVVTGGTEDVDNQRSGAGMERDSQPGLTQSVGTGAVQSGGFGPAAASLRQGSEATGEEGNTKPGTDGVSGRETAVAGTGRDSTVQGTVNGLDGSRPAGTELNQRSSDFVDAGVQVEPVATAAVDKVAERNDAAAVKREQQRLAQKVAVVPGDLENIRQSLPILLPGQDTDVQFAETRFAKPDGYGVLFTNGTGTGKTFSGLGIIKRFERQGKKNILIIAPQDNVIKSWLDAGRLLQLDITPLKDTNDAGSGIVITTFANFGTNSALASRSWDLIVADEAQYLNSNKSGGATKAQSMLRAITLHPDGGWQRSQLLNAELFAKYQAAHEKGSTVTKEQRETITARWREVDKQTRDAVAATKPEERTRVLFLSATPFAYHKSIDYANGYLFDYNDGQPKDEYRGYNSGSNYDRFFMTHFGYRMRTGKLTEPPAEVNVGLMERMFNSWLKKNGVLSGRMLAVEQDYDRKFVLVDSAIGRKIDEGLEILRQDEYRPLQERVWKAFDYLHRRFLLEAIKAKEVIPHIKEHIALGRKVLVFHDYNQGGGINPFDVRHLVGNGEEVTVNDRKTTLGAIASTFIKAHPDLVELPFKQYGSALSTLQAAFPDALTVNGTNSKKVNLAAVEQFQTDNNGKHLIVVQADKGKEGISLHDTTGVHPRVMFNLGLPVKPTMSIQQEGRIYRTGQASNAMQRYMNTGTAWERYAFATTLARRASTAENLAMGEEARMLLDAFVQAYEDSDSYPAGHEGEGTGGKERDRAANSALTEWDRAVSFYFANQKKNSKTKAQEGTDYFATPEPLGLKMAEWADVLPGEAVLEPSAGHGAIAMWFPDQAKRRAIEPSLNLTSKLALRFDGDIVQGSFEDHNTINKYDAIVMNPPFGTAGKTAMEHVAKAAQHLKDHGRIVALIPAGPAMDKRFDKWLYEEKVEKVEPLYVDAKLGPVYRGDTIVFNFFGKSKDMVVWDIFAGGSAHYARPRSGETRDAINLIVAEKLESTGPREKRTTNPMQLTAEILLPSATFERAGTSVNTRIVILDKDGEGQGVRRDYSRAENINDFFERIKDSEIPGRQHASQPNNETTPVTVDQVQPDGTVTADLQSDDFDLANFPHTQSGAMMYVATLNKRDAALYARALQVAKRNGGRYSKYSQGGAVAGFLFKDEASRGKFLQAMNGEATHVSIARNIRYRPGTTAAEMQAAEELVRSTTTDAQSSTQRASAYAGRRNAGILSSAISTEIRRNGTVDFVGKQITSPEDLAAIAQVYRNPQYETLRYFFTKDDRIVGQLGVSSRLPGNSKPFPGTMDIDDGSAWLQQRMADFGANGYYLLHNHPNGDVTVSDDDLKATREIVARVPGFKAHVVINHNIYNTIYKKDLQPGADRPKSTIKQFKAGPDQVRTPGKPSPFLGSILHGTDELAALGKQIEVQDGNILFVVSSGNVGIVGLAEQPVNETPERIAAYVKRLALKTGGGHVFAVVPENTRKYLTADQEQALRAFAVTAVEQGYLIDAVMQGKSLVQGVENGQKHGVYFGKDLYGYHVSQSAWHGSPHDYDKFSTDKIGTGEGAQVYGWGLYFAGAREVAEHYRKTLAGDPMNIPFRSILKSVFPDREFTMTESSDIFNGVLQKDVTGKMIWNRNRSLRDLDPKKLDQVIAKSIEASKGRLYKVELAPAEEDYLLWDKPLSEQSEKVKAALKDELEFLEFDYSDSPANPLKMSGAEFYRGLPKESDRATSEYLHSLGIRGIKYLDGNSRTMADLQIEEGEYLNGEPRYTVNGPNGDVSFDTRTEAQEYIDNYQEKLNYNYVIFNDADVTITTKFSLNEDTESFTGLQASDVRKVMPWVNVVQSVDEVPEKVLADAAAMGAKPWNIEGFIHEGKVWLVAENIRSISRAKVVAHVHELAHLGQDDRLVDLAVDWFNSTKGDDAPFKQEAHALLQEEAAKRNLDLNKPEDHRMAVREATARLAEDMAAKGLKPGLIQKIVNHLRELLRKLGRPLRVTDQELAGAVAEMLRLGEKRLTGASSLQENRLNGQTASGMIKEKEQDNGTGSRNNTRNNSRLGKAQASHFRDAKAISGGVYFSIPENARRSQVRDEETRALKAFAEQNGLMLDAVPMKREIELQGISGLDNLVYYQDGAYIKANKFTHTGTFTDLFINISLHNKVFPDAQYLFEGFVELDGMFRPVFSQQAFVNDMAEEDQRRELERLAANVLVTENGFARVDGDFKLVSQATFTRKDIVVRDINYRNVLHHNGEVIFFDPIVELKDEARTRENLQSLLFDDESGRAQFSLRSRVAEAVDSIPWDEVLKTTRNNWMSIINPLDWSRSWKVAQDWTPEQIKAAFGWFFMNPYFQAERDPAKQPFVAAGESRETNRMQIMLDFLGYNPGQDDTRSMGKKTLDFFTKWENGQVNTDWEKINQRIFALNKAQAAALDLIFVEGDAMGSEYASLAVARLNPRLERAAGMDATVFKLYKDMREHIDGTVAAARVRHMENMMRSIPDMTDKEIEKHIGDYRNSLRNVRGWLTRDHGEGREQVAVYHVFTAEEMSEDWRAKELFDKDGEPSGTQFFLPYYPGNKVMQIIETRIKEGWQEAKAKVITTAKGHVVLTINGDAAAAMEEIDSVIAEQMKDQQISVMAYMHRFQTTGGAKLHAKKVQADYKKAMSRGFIAGHNYVTKIETADTLSEDMFQAMKGDMAIEAALKESLKKAFQRGEIDKEKFEALNDQLVQDTAEVLLSRAAGRYQIRRAPYLIEGYATEGVASLYQDYMMGVAGMLSKAKYAMEQYEHLRNAGAKVKPWAIGYVFDTLRNMGLADRVSGDIRSFASLWLMGLKISSALINATQPYTLGLAELDRVMPDNKSGLKLIGLAQGNIVSGKGLKQDEQAIFETAVYKHQEMQTALGELSGHNEGTYTKAGKLLQGLTSKALALFQHVEVLNRKSVILAAYRAFRSDLLPAGVLDQAALEKALKVNSSVNFEMGRHNLPGFARNAVGRTLYSLQPFAWNSLNWIFNRLTSGEQRDMIALLRYAGAIAVLGGAMALPGGDELDKLYRRLRGRSIKLDLQEWSGKHVAEYGTFGEMINAFAWHGLPSVAGINVSNALRLQMPVVSQVLADRSALEATTGVPGALWNKMETAATFAGRGAPLRAVEAAAPEFIAGPLRAARMYREGATTSHGKRIFDEDGQPLQYSAGDAVKRGLGFQPLKQSQRSALTEQMQALEKYWGKDQKDLMDAIRFARDDDARDKAIDKVQEYNEKLLESQALGLVTPITGSKIRNGLTYKPNRKQTGWKQQHSN